MSDFTRYTTNMGKAILAKREAGKTLEALAAEYKASTRSISNWIVKATEEKRGTKTAKIIRKPVQAKKGQKETVSANVKPVEVLKTNQTAMITKETQMLLEEISYLHWWKEGELRGYVKRLLEEFTQCRKLK